VNAPVSPRGFHLFNRSLFDDNFGLKVIRDHLFVRSLKSRKFRLAVTGIER
jgi:hypothetical protein